ncbi:MAG: hypothetical protein OEZ16_12260 [Chromatiales bacterium]|nr:hypothetical protein [Chromatiales bacterium]
MAWNIEIMAYKPADLGFDDIIPDIFERTDKVVTFEEATSSKMKGKLCIGNFNNTTILIDVNCKIAGKIQDFTKLTRNREMHFARVSSNEIVYSAKNNKKYTEGSVFGRLLGQKSGPEYTDDMDGEQRAWEYLSHYLKMNCPEALFESKYTVYVLDL